MKTFIRLFTNDGGHYCIAPEHWPHLVAAIYNEAKNPFITVNLVASPTTIWIRVSQIQSFFMSTEENRRLASQWEQSINFEQSEEKEPWQE